MDDKEFYVEVKGNHMDYDMAKKYRDDLPGMNMKKFLIIGYCIIVSVTFIKGIVKHEMNVLTGVIVIFMPILPYIFCYFSASSMKLTKLLNSLKEIHGIDELNYSIEFGNQTFKVNTEGISTEKRYSQITKIIKTNEGIFICFLDGYFIYCDFSKMDTESQETLLKRLHKEPKIKWIDKRGS